MLLMSYLHAVLNEPFQFPLNLIRTYSLYSIYIMRQLLLTSEPAQLSWYFKFTGLVLILVDTSWRTGTVLVIFEKKIKFNNIRNELL